MRQQAYTIGAPKGVYFTPVSYPQRLHWDKNVYQYKTLQLITLKEDFYRNFFLVECVQVRTQTMGAAQNEVCPAAFNLPSPF